MAMVPILAVRLLELSGHTSPTPPHKLNVFIVTAKLHVIPQTTIIMEVGRLVTPRLVPLHVNKKLSMGRLYFKTADVSIIDDGVDVMAELEDFFNESIRKRRRTKACGRSRESQRKRKDS